jgi:DNA-binding XRE family transcriptional regulator
VTGSGPSPRTPNHLAKFRWEAGLSQEALARRADLSVFTISRLETGVQKPRLAHARKIAAALDRTIDEIWPDLEAA